MPPVHARRASNQATSAAAWHVQQARKAQDQGDQIREDLERSFAVDKDEYEKRGPQLEALHKRIAEIEASIRARRFVVNAAARMKRPSNSGAETYLANARAKCSEQTEELEDLKKQLKDANTSWTKYFGERNVGRKDRLDALARAAQKVQFHVVRAGTLESPTDEVLKLLKRSEALLTGPFQRATKGTMWKKSRLDFTIDPKHFQNQR
ncbi:MAG: hypothetical protein Q9160_008374 [Pyrenula sp. 1 TL-2023]